jgi:hypothetical protein
VSEHAKFLLFALLAGEIAAEQGSRVTASTARYINNILLYNINYNYSPLHTSSHTTFHWRMIPAPIQAGSIAMPYVTTRYERAKLYEEVWARARNCGFQALRHLGCRAEKNLPEARGTATTAWVLGTD